MESRKQFPIVWQILAYLVMVGFTLLTVGPLIWLVYSSFKPHPGVYRGKYERIAQRAKKVIEQIAER